VKNGELLRRAAGLVDTFLTMDRKLEFEHDLAAVSRVMFTGKAINLEWRRARLALQVTSIVPCGHRISAFDQHGAQTASRAALPPSERGHPWTPSSTVL